MPSYQISELPLDKQYMNHINGTELFKQNRRRSIWRSFLAFFLPMLILAVAFAIQGASPFGDRHILTVDLYHQYAPFLIIFRDKLLNGGSLFFSWSGGLGVNFYALLSYYLASPLNFLFALFSENLISDFVWFLVIVKIGLAGLSFHLFLKKSFKRDGPLSLALAVAYALSGYTMAFFFNIMWLDTLYFLPLLCYALILLIREKYYAPYIILLALTLGSNFYSGFFAAFFIFFFFFVLLEREELKGFKDNFLVFMRVAMATVFGIALAAILLYPTYKAMSLTSAVGDKFPENAEMIFPNVDFLSRFMPLSPVSIRDGMANIYSGIIVLPLIFTFFAAKKISVRRKIINFALLVFLLLSVNLNYLDFIWHGFHFPNQLPYRNSFVIVFFVLYLAYDGLPHIKDLERPVLYRSTALLVFSFFLLQKVDAYNYSHLSMLVALFFLIAYVAMLAQMTRQPAPLPGYYPLRERKREIRNNHGFSVILCSLIIAELIVNSFVSINSVEDAEYFGPREGYGYGEEVEAIYNMVDKLHAEENTDLCRIEIKQDKTVNDCMLYRSNGLSIFSSTCPEKSVSYISRLGYPNNGINSYQYMGSTPIMDAILGLDYKLHRGADYFLDSQHELVHKNDHVHALKSKNALPIAFLTNIPSVANWPALGTPYDEENELNNMPESFLDLSQPFREQEQLFNYLSGQQSEEIFEEVAMEEVPQERIGLQLSGQNGDYDIVRDNSYNAKIMFKTEIEEPGDYYIFWDISDLSMEDIKVAKILDNEFKVGRKTKGFTEIGSYVEEDQINVTIDLSSVKDKNHTGRMKIGLFRFNQERFQEGMDILLDKKAKIVDFGDDHIEIETNEASDSVLFVSTTANPGWRAYLDNKEVPIKLLQSCFLLVDVPRGEHQLSLRFSPPGFESGKLISMVAAVAVLLFLIMDIVYWRRSKRKNLAPKTANLAEAKAKVKPDLAAGWPQHFQGSTVSREGYPEEESLAEAESDWPEMISESPESEIEDEQREEDNEKIIDITKTKDDEGGEV